MKTLQLPNLDRWFDREMSERLRITKIVGIGKAHGPISARSGVAEMGTGQVALEVNNGDNDSSQRIIVDVLNGSSEKMPSGAGIDDGTRVEVSKDSAERFWVSRKITSGYNGE